MLNETLKHWKAQQEENEQKFGDRYVYTDSDNKIFQQSKGLVSNIRRELPLCTYEDGRLIWVNAVGKFLRISGLNAHSFRHTHATMLIENGASPKGVAGRLGHANISITQNLYAHNTQKLQEDTVEIFVKSLQTTWRQK